MCRRSIAGSLGLGMVWAVECVLGRLALVARPEHHGSRIARYNGRWRCRVLDCHVVRKLAIREATNTRASNRRRRSTRTRTSREIYLRPVATLLDRSLVFRALAKSVSSSDGPQNGDETLERIATDSAVELERGLSVSWHRHRAQEL